MSHGDTTASATVDIGGSAAQRYHIPMRVRFTGAPDFWLAFLGAPFAGAVAMTLAALLAIASSGHDGVAPEEAIVGSLQAGLFGLAICARGRTIAP